MRFAVTGLECSNCMLRLQRHADVVETVDQTMFSMRFDLELEPLTVGSNDRLCGQIDRQRVALLAGYLCKKLIDNNFI